MLASVRAEALSRISATRDVLRLVDAHECQHGGGDVASRSAKGLVFVQNYGVYEYVVVHVVRSLVTAVNNSLLQFSAVRAELLSMALDREFASVIGGSAKKTWSARCALLARARSSAPVSIQDGLFPKDGSHFRTAQLDTIWTLFGIPGPIVVQPRHRRLIEEMIENRNRIAHGEDPPDAVGGGFTTADLTVRVDGVEAVCTHIINTVTGYIQAPVAFR